MAGMPWIKLYSEMLDDPKIGRLSDALKWRFVQLCLYAGELDQDGYLPGDLYDAAWRLRISVEQLQADLETLDQARLVHYDEDCGQWCVTQFAERQGRPQESKREQWRQAQQRRRQALQEESCETVETVENDVIHESCMTPVGVILLDKDKDKDKESDKEEEKTIKPAAAQPAEAPAPPPTLSVSAAGENQEEPEKAPMSAGVKGFLTAFGAKRFKTVIQRRTVEQLERQYGTKNLTECAEWAAKRGLDLGGAVVAAESALPGWGAKKNGNGSRASPGGSTATRGRTGAIERARQELANGNRGKST